MTPCEYPTHKPMTAYQYGCRCPRCKQAHREYHTEYHRRLRERAAIANGRDKPADPTRYPYWLYRFIDSAGATIYVGMTRSPANRLGHHRTTFEGWNLIHRIDMTNVGPLTKREADKVEAGEIGRWMPEFNTHFVDD